MYAPLEKKEKTNRPIHNSVTQNKSNGKKGFGFLNYEIDELSEYYNSKNYTNNNSTVAQKVDKATGANGIFIMIEGAIGLYLSKTLGKLANLIKVLRGALVAVLGFGEDKISDKFKENAKKGVIIIKGVEAMLVGLNKQFTKNTLDIYFAIVKGFRSFLDWMILTYPNTKPIYSLMLNTLELFLHSTEAILINKNSINKIKKEKIKKGFDLVINRFISFSKSFRSLILSFFPKVKKNLDRKKQNDRNEHGIEDLTEVSINGTMEIEWGNIEPL